MTKAPTPTEKSKKQRDNKNRRHQNFEYTTITDRLRTVVSFENIKFTVKQC